MELTAVYTVLAEALRINGKLDQAREHITTALDAEAGRPGSIGHAMALVFDAQLALTERDRARAQASAAHARRMLAGYHDAGTLAQRLQQIETALTSATTHSLGGSRPTRSEQRILELLVTDLTVAQIAERLYLSYDTVRSHLRRLYQRLDAHDRQQAIAVARRRQLL